MVFKNQWNTHCFHSFLFSTWIVLSLLRGRNVQTLCNTHIDIACYIARQHISREGEMMIFVQKSIIQSFFFFSFWIPISAGLSCHIMMHAGYSAYHSPSIADANDHRSSRCQLKQSKAPSTCGAKCPPIHSTQTVETSVIPSNVHKNISHMYLCENTWACR